MPRWSTRPTASSAMSVIWYGVLRRRSMSGMLGAGASMWVDRPTSRLS